MSRPGKPDRSKWSVEDAIEFVELVREGLANSRPPRFTTAESARILDAILNNVYHFLVGSRPNAENLQSMYGVDMNGEQTGIFPEHGLGYFWENVMEGLRFQSSLWSDGGLNTHDAVIFKNSRSDNFYSHREVALQMFLAQLKYMRASKAAGRAALPSLHKLQLNPNAHRHNHRQAPHHSTQGRAFLYIVASGGRGDSGKYGADNRPMLLLLNHKHYGYYGVPGGLQDPGDDTLQATALREFTEEFLDMDHRSKDDQKNAAKIMLATGAGGPAAGGVHELHRSPDGTMAAFLLVVRNTRTFEAMAQLLNRKIDSYASDDQKRTRQGGISREMDGYAWFALEDIRNEISNPRKEINQRGGIVVKDRSGRRLLTRAYTIGHNTHNGWKQSHAMETILSMFP